MNSVSTLKQTQVYFRKVARISMREKAWKYIIFAVIIAGIVAFVISDNMLETFEGTKSGFFTIASACIWVGIFNSIQSICKEHDIIRSEYRQGMKMTAYVMANVIWQFILSLVQSAIIFILCIILVDVESDALLFDPYVEYFITILLLTFGSSVLGLMVSSIAGNPTTAMTIMPFVLIVQLILSGVLFELEGAMEVFAWITFSKWGMSAFGSIADMNDIEMSLLADDKELKQQLELMGKDISSNNDMYDHDEWNLIGAWLMCLAITLVCIIVSTISLKLKNRDS